MSSSSLWRPTSHRVTNCACNELKSYLIYYGSHYLDEFNKWFRVVTADTKHIIECLHRLLMVSLPKERKSLGNRSYQRRIGTIRLTVTNSVRSESSCKEEVHITIRASSNAWSQLRSRARIRARLASEYVTSSEQSGFAISFDNKSSAFSKFPSLHASCTA